MFYLRGSPLKVSSLYSPTIFAVSSMGFSPTFHFTKENNMVDQMVAYVKKFTEAGMALLALGIVMQVLFGKAVPFVGGDIVGNITAIVGTLGAQGVVGLAAVGVIYAIFNRS